MRQRKRAKPRTRRAHARLIANNIRARRRALGVSQAELSRTIGYDDEGKFFHRVESGGQSIPSEYLPVIGERLQVDDIRRFYDEDAFIE